MDNFTCKKCNKPLSLLLGNKETGKDFNYKIPSRVIVNIDDEDKDEDLFYCKACNIRYSRSEIN